MNVIIGLVAAIIGIVLVIGTETVLKMFGRMNFAEKFFSTSGGSRWIYKLIGIGFIFLGFIIIFNMHLGALEWMAVNLFGAYADENAPQPVEYYEVR